MTLNTKALCRWTAGLLVAATTCLSSGCATLAHRSSVSGQHAQTTSNCDGHGDVCPWLGGDALLLIPGVVPGVVAFAVDFGTGAWQHDGHGETGRQDDALAAAKTEKQNR